MKVALSTIGKFHSFDLARQLHAHGALAGIFTGYPRFKLRHERLPQHLVHTFPWMHTPYMGLPRRRELLGDRLVKAWEYLDAVTLDTHVARNLPECDVFVGLSGSSLRSGRIARRHGARYVCDRGCAHIRVQDHLLREEHEHWGLPFAGIDPRVIVREETEYAGADCITVPSGFAMRSFQSQGIPASKLRRLPYGVDLGRFEPTGSPASGRFDVLFVGCMSLQKGVPYLLQAYRRIVHSRKSITFAGAPSPALIALMKQRALWPDEARVLGHVPQHRLKDLYSRSHALVLPSVQDGFGMVMSEAMACGCVVIGTSHTGAEDLLTDGKDGFITPVRNVDALVQRLQQLADSPALRDAMGQRALSRMRSIGGWRQYGNAALSIYGALIIDAAGAVGAATRNHASAAA
jgi:glycosyltransferase involved in cell wall biosynthesis